MISKERYCKSCGHRCHCYSPDCSECKNDVCISCKCSSSQKSFWPDNPGEAYSI